MRGFNSVVLNSLDLLLLVWLLAGLFACIVVWYGSDWLVIGLLFVALGLVFDCCVFWLGVLFMVIAGKY